MLHPEISFHGLADTQDNRNFEKVFESTGSEPRTIWSWDDIANLKTDTIAIVTYWKAATLQVSRKLYKSPTTKICLKMTQENAKVLRET